MKKLLRWRGSWLAGRRITKIINDHNIAYRVGYEDGQKAGYETGRAHGWSEVRHYLKDK